MKTTQTKTKQRRNKEGQYTHTLEKVCVCGATKGQHMAVAPHDLDDTDCLGFRLRK